MYRESALAAQYLVVASSEKISKILVALSASNCGEAL